VVWILWGLTALGSAVGLVTRRMPLAVVAGAALLIGICSIFGLFLSTLPPYGVARQRLVRRALRPEWGRRFRLPTV
jgi:hypothetical protein